MGGEWNDARRASDAAEGLYSAARWLLCHGRHREAAAVARAMVRLAAGDERGWLALGACHEGIEQPEIALEIYGVGRAVARPAPRCEMARARLLLALGRDDEGHHAYALASQAAATAGDDDLCHLIEHEWKGRELV
ncbi:MAG: hypothetical protein FWD17_06125 [Polyangiaceae bacterium]|nr:hypothetical protein [Polyangiaceae bacterium]